MLAYAEVATLVILIVCSVIMVGIVLERLLAWRKIRSNATRFRKTLEPVLEEGDADQLRDICLKSVAPLATVLTATCEIETDLRPDQTQMLLAHGVEDASTRLRNFLSILATLAGAAPFIGLFGTVLGIMHTFTAIAAKGFGGPAVVSAGISQALVATAAGLAVAIPSVIFYNYFTKKANQEVRVTEAEATQILIMMGRL